MDLYSVLEIRRISALICYSPGRKYDTIKMSELVKVEDPDSDGGLTLIFSENKTLKIKIVDGKLVSEFV